MKIRGVEGETQIDVDFKTNDYAYVEIRFQGKLTNVSIWKKVSEVNKT